MGENIRQERVSRNISIDELAEILDLTPGFVGLMERGKRGAALITLLKLSDIFGISIDSFFFKSKSSALSFSDEHTSETQAYHKKIESLISDFTDKELEFLVSTIKNMRTMNRPQAIK